MVTAVTPNVAMTTAVSAVLGEFRPRHPLVQCQTNIVVAGFTANVLLAAGASPAMVDDAEETAGFTPAADGLLINVGTLSPGRVAAFGVAARAAAGVTPWVLDPVGAGASAVRTRVARDLLSQGPTAVRGNASEVLALIDPDDPALAGFGGGPGGRGVDSGVDSAAALGAAVALARRHRCVVAVSGVVDLITDGVSVVEVHGGHPLMTVVTGVGCALGALVAAFLPVAGTPLIAAVAATALLDAAGSRAAVHARGPGSFAVALLDQLAVLDPAAVAAATTIVVRR